MRIEGQILSFEEKIWNKISVQDEFTDKLFCVWWSTECWKKNSEFME